MVSRYARCRARGRGLRAGRVATFFPALCPTGSEATNITVRGATIRERGGSPAGGEAAAASIGVRLHRRRSGRRGDAPRERARVRGRLVPAPLRGGNAADRKSTRLN